MDTELIELRNEEAESEDGPITDKALQIADEVLGYRPDFRPSIAPDSDGGIRMEWQHEHKTMRRGNSQQWPQFLYLHARAGAGVTGLCSTEN